MAKQIKACALIKAARTESKAIINIREVMVNAGIHHDIDEIALSMLARSINRLNNIDSMGLEPDAALDMELKLMNTITKHLATLGLTKTKQLQIQSSIRGRGRPTKAHKLEDDNAADWEGLIDE